MFIFHFQRRQLPSLIFWSEWCKGQDSFTSQRQQVIEAGGNLCEISEWIRTDPP